MVHAFHKLPVFWGGHGTRLLQELVFSENTFLAGRRALSRQGSSDGREDSK